MISSSLFSLGGPTAIRRWGTAAAVAVLGLLGVPTAPANAAPEPEATPTYVPPDFLKETPPLPESAGTETPWRLGLEEALRVAVKENLGVVLERETEQISRLGIDVARGVFEPGLSLSYQHSAVPTGGSDDLALGYAQRFATGLELSVDFDSVRTRSTAPRVVGSALTVHLRQPLLRGFSTDLVVPRLPVLRAKLSSKRERHQLAIVIADVVERTERAYWDVVQALHGHALEVRSARRAEDQLTLTARQIEAGILPPSDLLAAESTLAQRRLQQVQAEQAVEAAWDQLRAVLNLPKATWTRPIVPVDLPGFEPTTVSGQDALNRALTHRPEYAQLEIDVEDAALAVRAAENDRLPQIDVGVSGSVTGEDSGYGGSLDDLTSFGARSWSVLVNMSWTPLSRANRATQEIERRRRTMAETRRDQLRQEVWEEVRTAVRNQDSAARQVAAAARFRELAERSLDVEERKFLAGTSSTFFVTQRQEDVAAAQLAELSAVLDHRKARTALLHVTGELLATRRIEVGPATP